jgi:hypothetical protein
MKRGWLIFTALLLAACPLAGGLATGLAPGFFSFPPLLEKIHHPPDFDPLVFAAYAFLAIWIAWPLLVPSHFGFRPPPQPPVPTPPPRSWPRHGRLGVLLIALAWTAAWTRPSWIGPLAHYTFAPLWVGYVLAVDGLVVWRSGRSRLRDQPRAFALLFAGSAPIWWYFEYLNRFVKNWWYEGTEVFTPAAYVLFATLCFSTVLPAILETADLLLTFPRFARRYTCGPRLRGWSPAALVATLAAGAAGLMALTRWPDAAFPLTWIAPLAVTAAGLGLARHATPCHPFRDGDWSRMVTLAVAAVICGMFWEMWNFLALPKWHYAVPYVQVLHFFDMPLLGFLGYLPFGPLCWCLWALLAGLIGRQVALPGDRNTPRSTDDGQNPAPR